MQLPVHILHMYLQLLVLVIYLNKGIGDVCHVSRAKYTLFVRLMLL